jgi:hypothetical protein
MKLTYPLLLNAKPQAKPYKLTDRDSMYLRVSVSASNVVAVALANKVARTIRALLAYGAKVSRSDIDDSLKTALQSDTNSLMVA